MSGRCFRWVSPAGECANGYLDADAARYAAVSRACGRTGSEPVDIEPGQVEFLWRGLERGGWKIEMASPLERAR